MIHHFNHRFGDYTDLPPGSSSTQLPGVPLEHLQNPSYAPHSRYWVTKEEVEQRLRKAGWKHKWLLGWRDITNSTNERTAIATVFPRVGVGNNLPIFLTDADPKLAVSLLANLSSFVFDYFTRMKVPGTHINFYIAHQLPVLPPSAFDAACPWETKTTLYDWISERVLELVYTSWDMQPLAEDCGYSGPPFPWDEERRFQLRCELDAAFFHLYGIPEEDIPYIMDTFPIVKRKDEQAHGEYRTLLRIQTILEAIEC